MNLNVLLLTYLGLVFKGIPIAPDLLTAQGSLARIHSPGREPPLAKFRPIFFNKKVQPNSFEDLTGFIKQFMSWAPSHLASTRGTSRDCRKQKDCRKGVGKGHSR